MNISHDATKLDASLLQRLSQCLQAGDKQTLIALLESHVRDNPASAPSALLFVASHLSQNGQHAEAVPLYEEALRLKPTEPIIYFYLGLAYHGLKQSSDRQRIWGELPKRFPEHALTDYQAALCLIEANRMQAALPLLKQAIGKLEKGSALRAQVESTLRAIG